MLPQLLPIPAIVCLLLVNIGSHQAFKDHENDHDFHNPSGDQHDAPRTPPSQQHKHSPKDRILLNDVKTLTFSRNKRTTSRRTHSIHQLSCVGGTAGCKLFTPDTVECENRGYDRDKSKHNWRCQADVSDRVQFNHVEVICEGYDYPEDDYILIGSCGLEFTLDYKDPLDYHHQSYFKHMDEHEKELHHEKVRAKLGEVKSDSLNLSRLSLVVAVIMFAIFVFITVRYLSANDNASPGGPANKRKPSRSYGPLASAVMTTKKAC